MNAALLLSGGMDSLAIAWWKRPQLAITLDYGQNAAVGEKHAAGRICEELGIPHEIIRIDCGSLGSGDMAQSAPHPAAPTSEWWPYRNQLLITLASMCAIARGIEALYIGTVRSDGDSHRDGTNGFIARIDELMAFQEGGVRVLAPAIELSTAELVRKAGVPASLLAWAHSCHKAEIACGNCRGCAKYLATYAELGAEYQGAS